MAYAQATSRGSLCFHHGIVWMQLFTCWARTWATFVISRQSIAEVRLRREAVESFDRYPFSLAAVRPLEKLELHPAVTFFVGENGSGKSTLLEAIAVACGSNAEGGSKNFRFGTRDSHSELHRFLRIARGFPHPLI